MQRVRMWSMLLLVAACSSSSGGGSNEGGTGEETGNGSGGVGAPCTAGEHCESGVCIPNAPGAMEGTCRGECPGAIGSAVCAGDGQSCLPGWSSWSLSGSAPYYCMCLSSLSQEDECNGMDSNCNGIVDEDGDAMCAALAPGHQCDEGGCVDCPLRCEGTCTNPTRDLENCGGCGTSCGAPTASADPICSANGCRWAEIVSPSEGRLVLPRLDDTHVYYRVDFNILRCPLGGCTAQPEVVSSQVGYANTLVVHEGQLFWSAENRLSSCPTTGCDTPSILGDQASYYYGFVIVDDTLHVLASYDGETGIIRCSTGDGCADPPDFVVSDLANHPQHLITDGTHLYFERRHDVDLGDEYNGAYLRCPLSGCTDPEELVSGVYPGWGMFAVANGQLYFHDAYDDPDTYGSRVHQIHRCLTDDCAGSREVVADRIDPGRELRIDGDAMYWITDTSIESCSTSGCTAASPVAAGLSALSGLAHDADAFYVTSDGNPDPVQGKLRRITR